MRRYALSLLLLTSTVSAGQSLIIEDVTIVSSHLKKPKPHQHVLIEDGKITQISSIPVSKSKNTPRINGSNQFLTPGIMDSHIHVSSVPGIGFGVEPRAQSHKSLTSSYYEQQPKSHLYYGITQILDPNPGKNWQHYTQSEIHPDFFRCEVITSATTYPSVEMKPETAAALYQWMVDENAPVNGEASPEQLVDKIAASQARCIKLYFEDGYGSNTDWALLKPATLKRIRQAADKHQLPVLAHANSLNMYKAAIAAEADILVHGMWNWDDAKTDDKRLPADIVDVLITMKNKKIGFMPTQRIVTGLAELMNQAKIDKSLFNDVSPKQLRDWYATPEAAWFRNELQAAFGDDMSPEKIADILQTGTLKQGRQVINMLYQLRHPILLGSDSPGSYSYANQPGLNTYQEIEMLARSGIPLMEVLKAATIHNARQFGLDDDYGTVEKGKVANLLLLNKNPLKDVSAWKDIDAVVLHGQHIKRDTLKAQ